AEVPESSIAPDDADRDELTLAYNAFHGIGTTLIALPAELAGDPNASAGFAIARERCGVDGAAERPSQQMRLALACLERTTDIRRNKLRQTEQDVDGTQENFGFAYLRDDDFASAYANSVRVEHTLLSPWNELIRAVSAAEMRRTARTGDERRAAIAASI